MFRKIYLIIKDHLNLPRKYLDLVKAHRDLKSKYMDLYVYAQQVTYEYKKLKKKVKNDTPRNFV